MTITMTMTGDETDELVLFDNVEGEASEARVNQLQ
jgi:hypothetical protein